MTRVRSGRRRVCPVIQRIFGLCAAGQPDAQHAHPSTPGGLDMIKMFFSTGIHFFSTSIEVLGLGFRV